MGTLHRGADKISMGKLLANMAKNQARACRCLVRGRCATAGVFSIPTYLCDCEAINDTSRATYSWNAWKRVLLHGNWLWTSYSNEFFSKSLYPAFDIMPCELSAARVENNDPILDKGNEKFVRFSTLRFSSNVERQLISGNVDSRDATEKCCGLPLSASLVGVCVGLHWPEGL